MHHRTKLLMGLPILLAMMWETPQAQLTQYNFDDAISGMMSAGSRAAKVAKLRQVSSITVVRLKQIVVFRHPGDEPELPAVKISAQKNAAGIARLRAALRSNPVTSAALAAKGISVNRILAVEIIANDTLKIFIL